ncbi:Proteasome maturation isoform B [Chlorella sorokiniana]|uniref:Proteasome maturation isoform B n=1 Tax=Chlorella sorokiniana TaxID=3076 RepID=A0A2P6TB94_CHLSO|nr:Proteasome maturation isoform B [Chlorella sorokiniana]|eukprot:PRW05823.1 Proteasome maturation isoform B [Chlorella sorokiniana]
MQDSLPFLAAPHDALRQGLVTLKDGAAVSHPVEQIQQMAGPAGEQSRLEMLRNVYGTALPARMQIEKQILDRHERLPGLPSSKLGLEAMTGALEDFGFESYLGLPQDSEAPQPDLHSQMEQRLGMAGGTKPMARGLPM